MQAVSFSRGMIPDHYQENVIHRWEKKGDADMVSLLTESLQQQRKALSKSAQRQEKAIAKHEAALKKQTESLIAEPRNYGLIGQAMGILPDGQIVRVYSCRNQSSFSYAVLMRDGPTPSGDVTVNEAYDGSAYTYDFLKAIFNRRSIDNRNFPLNSYVHYGYRYNNAYWDGRRMVYGDGDGRYFNRFTIDIEIPAHEQAHGLTSYEAGRKVDPYGRPLGINYFGEAGGINESYSDQIGIMVKQWRKNQDALSSNWLIAENLIKPLSGRAYALRSMANPGTAFVNHPALGTDTQIAHYADYVSRAAQGEVDPHDSSGIVNKAFAVAAINYGGPSWVTIGKVFFDTLPYVKPDETFKGLADKTLNTARTQIPADTRAADALLTGWRAVGVLS